MKTKMILLLLLSSLSFQAWALRPFETDQCTGYIEGDWAHCCVQHDLLLWAGGTLEESHKADLDLRECVRETGNEFHAQLMYLGIRIGRRSPYKLEGKQWGNAWGDKVRHEALTEQEVDLLVTHLMTIDLPDWMMEDFLRRHQ